MKCLTSTSSAKLKCPACQLTTSTIFYLQHEIMSRLKSTGKLSPVPTGFGLNAGDPHVLATTCCNAMSRAGSPASPRDQHGAGEDGAEPPGAGSARCGAISGRARSLDYRREALKCSDIGQIGLLCSSSHCHRSCCAAQKHRVLCEAAPAAVLPFLFIFFLSLRSFLLFQKDYKTIQAAETQPLRSLAFQISLKN